MITRMIKRRRRLRIRTRLTLLYGAALLAAGSVLIGLFALLLSRGLLGGDAARAQLIGLGNRNLQPGEEITLGNGQQISYATLLTIERAIDARRQLALENLIWQCVIALLVVTAISVLFGWLMSSRALRPVHEITATAERVAATNLAERIRLQGPRDEVGELADTFDAMLDRLAAAFDSQRRFIANASHELRTPLATQRTLLEVGLTQQAMSAPVRATMESLLTSNLRNEQLVDGLLTLARSEEDMINFRSVDLVDVVAGVVESTAAQASRAGVRVDIDPDVADVRGDRLLLERLTLNLVRNALLYNEKGGWVQIATGTLGDGTVELMITNTGPEITGHQARTLTEPFRRLDSTRLQNSEGAGLGLSIVAAIVRSHHGFLDITPRRGGGLVVRVRLPAAESDHGVASASVGGNLAARTAG